MHTPSIEEVRRYWGLAVDIHRREERLAQFDRMLEGVWESAVSFGHNSSLRLTDKLDENPYSSESFEDRWIKNRMSELIKSGGSHDHLKEEVQSEYDRVYNDIDVTVQLIKTNIEGSWTYEHGGNPVSVVCARMPYSVATSVVAHYDGTSNYDDNGVDIQLRILNPYEDVKVGKKLYRYTRASDFAISNNLREG